MSNAAARRAATDIQTSIAILAPVERPPPVEPESESESKEPALLPFDVVFDNAEVEVKVDVGIL